MISKHQLIQKRIFDLTASLLLLPILIVPIIVLVIASTLDTIQFGVFTQVRIGQHAKPFKIFKIRTLKSEEHLLGHLNMSATRLGRFLRHYKLDELPQIFNVIIGEMSFVGPRPDIVGFADELRGEDCIVLKVKPGITGPATLKYRNEEDILSKQPNPENYNRTIIWKDKVEINKKYVQNWSFYLDLSFLIKSLIT
ncbi:sugar transferase [Psychroserpens luteus]|uniref:Sugar transferase n=1 Tax=Psychroserpens luteus TaxID=1434066 RepID=A0ABW5ZX14_9FLAO|nr:sugar transferase [Psychroserpens luteus]